MLITARSQVVLIDEEEMSIDAAHFSLRIVRSNLAGSENKSYFSLLLVVLLDMHLKDTRNILCK